MKNKIKYIVFAFSLMFFAEFAKTQQDGTEGTPEYFNLLINNLSDEKDIYFDTTYNFIDVKLGINFYIVKDEMGLSNIQEDTIDAGIEVLNHFFSPIGISFRKDEVIHVKEYEYSYIDSIGDTQELLTKYARLNKINVFVVDSIKDNGIQYYGYADLPSDTVNNNIFICKSFFTGKNLTTQMGHYFGLLSTHERNGGIELVDTSNCSSSGDYLCDTYPDPGIYGLVDYQCHYNGSFMDTNLDLYAPSVANLMSDGLEQCKCIFTIGQYRRMYYYYNKYRHKALSR